MLTLLLNECPYKTGALGLGWGSGYLLWLNHRENLFTSSRIIVLDWLLYLLSFALMLILTWAQITPINYRVRLCILMCTPFRRALLATMRKWICSIEIKRGGISGIELFWLHQIKTVLILGDIQTLKMLIWIHVLGIWLLKVKV